MDLKKLKAHCQRTSDLTREVIDEILMPYAGQPKKLGKEMNRQFGHYRHITNGFPASMLPMLQSQYLVHGLFKRDGLIGKYLNHAELKIITDEHRAFLESQSSYPWQFSFAQIQESLDNNFYEMLDVFSGETYLLYSPGIGETLRDYPYRLWFNLIAFNGECYQTYGPLVGYQSFTPDDIFFFACELSEDVESDEDLRGLVERNPVPFMMLVTGSVLPSIIAEDDQELKYAFSEFIVPSLPEFFPEDIFNVEEYMGLVKLMLVEESVPPFAIAYYDREEKILQLTALTLDGYAKLAQSFKKLDLDFDEWPNLTVSFTMKEITEQILQREVEIFPYESLFEEGPDEEDSDLDEIDFFDYGVDYDDELDDLNKAIINTIPYLKRGEYPDIRGLAKKYNLEEEELKRTVDQLLDVLRKM